MTTENYVRPDGTSEIVQQAGLYDMAELGDNLVLDAEVEKKLASLNEELDTRDSKARYKLEVYFRENRSTWKPYGGFIVTWTNGGFAHGGGDETVYFCPSRVEAPGGGTKTCGEPIELPYVRKNFSVCPKCRNAVDPKELVGQIFAYLTPQRWATLLTKVFMRLGGDADIRLGLLKGDLRSASDREQERSIGGDVLREVRGGRQWVIYPLSHIIKDTATGADLEKRIYSFLVA